MPIFDFPDYSIDFNRALTAIPELIVGEAGVPDLTDPMTSYRYLEKRRQNLIESVKQRPLIRLWDKDMHYVGQIAAERSVMCEEVMAEAGAGNIVIRRDNWLSNFILYDRRVEEDLHVTLDPIPTQPDWRTRWGGKVIGVNAKRDKDGLHTVELEMVSNREHFSHVLAAANPIFAPEIQLPKMWVLPWNCRTAISITLFINLARQFFPFLSIPTNIFNPGAWLGVGILQGLDPLSWPIQIQFLNPLFDQSRFTILTSRWTDMQTVCAPLLEDAGCMVRAYTWLTEDKTSPHPELHLGLKDIPLIGPVLKQISDTTGLPTDLDELVRPHRNAIIMAVEDKSGTTGPTGTLLDGPIKLIAATADDLITEIIYPVDKNMDGATDPFFRKLALVAPHPPWVVFRDGEYSGIVESQRSLHACTAKTIMVGSKSPGWVNQLQTFAIKYALSELSAVIQAALPNPPSVEVTGWQNPGTPGLEEVYQGQLDDTLLAWQRFTDPVRAIRMGDFGFLEHFERGSGSAYTISGVLDIRTGHWKTRSYTSFKTTVRNGAPYLAGYDFALGDRLGFEMGNIIHVDQCTAIRYSWDDSQPIAVELLIGTGHEEEDPVMKATRTLASIWNTFGMFLGSSDLF